MNFIKNVLRFMLSMGTISGIARCIAICMSCIVFNTTVFAAPDCLDTSSHLKDTVDYKELRYVACNHDCYKNPNSRLVENRGKCSVCGHFHKPRPLVIVKTANPATLPAPTKKAKAKNMLAHLFARKNQ
jgi:hypothetical protein